MKKINQILILTNLLLLMTVNIGTARAETPDGLIVFDLTGETERVFSFRSEQYDEVKKMLVAKNKVRLGSEPLLDTKALKKLMQYDNNRFFTHEGDKIEVRIYYNNKTEREDIEKNISKFLSEEKRKSKFFSDISKQILQRKNVSSNRSGANTNILEPVIYNYIQLFDRSKLVASLNTKASDDYSILTGTKEHWFVSADLVVKDKSTIKYNSSSGILEPKEVPSAVYVSANYMLGDVVSEGQSLYDNFFVKAMVSFSQRPLDSIGLGIGYKFPENIIEWEDNKLGGFSLFGGAVWTKQDTISGAIVQPNSSYLAPVYTFGLGYDIEVLSSWGE